MPLEKFNSNKITRQEKLLTGTNFGGGDGSTNSQHEINDLNDRFKQRKANAAAEQAATTAPEAERAIIETRDQITARFIAGFESLSNRLREQPYAPAPQPTTLLGRLQDLVSGGEKARLD